MQGYKKTVFVITKEGDTELKSKCTGMWCHACTDNGCCKEQEIWDVIIKSNDRTLDN